MVWRLSNRRGGNDTRAGPLLPERAQSECARSTAAVGPTRVPFPNRTNKQAWKDHQKEEASDARSEGQSGCSPQGQSGKIGRPSPGLMARPGVPVGGRVRTLRAVEDQSAPIPRENTSKLGGNIYIVRCAQ